MSALGPLGVPHAPTPSARSEITRLAVATTEKVSTRMRLLARATSGHGSRPRPDNPIVALSQADTLWLKAEIERVVDNPAIEVVRFGRRRPVSDPMPIESELFRALESVQEDLFPNATTIPTMLTGGTDSSQLRAAGILTYGVGMPTDEATSSRAHGNDERTPVGGMRHFLEFLYRTVMAVAGR